MGSISSVVGISAPVSEVWAVLAGIGAISEWAPVVRWSSTTSEVGTGVGAERSCQLHLYGRVVERMTGWEAGRELTYSVSGPWYLRSMTNRWHLGASPTGTLAEFSATYELIGGPVGALVDRLLARHIIGRTIEQTLRALRAFCEDGLTEAKFQRT